MGLLGSEIYEIQDTWSGRCKLEYTNYALKTLPKGLTFFHPVSPLESPKVMGLTNIHHPDTLHHFNRVTHCLWCGREEQNGGMNVNHLQMMHYKLGLCARSAFAAPQSPQKPFAAMAGRAASPRWKGVLTSHLCQPNCKHNAHWVNIPKMGPGWRIRRRILHLSDCHIGDTPTPQSGTGGRIRQRNCLPSN